jgi:hypothetical protein
MRIQWLMLWRCDGAQGMPGDSISPRRTNDLTSYWTNPGLRNRLPLEPSPTSQPSVDTDLQPPLSSALDQARRDQREPAPSARALHMPARFEQPQEQMPQVVTQKPQPCDQGGRGALGGRRNNPR